MDKRLGQLITALCQHSDNSLQRRKAMHRLLIELQRLPGILKSSHPDYLEALNQTWEWLGRNICSRFELPTSEIQASLVKWINGYLKWRIRDVHSRRTSSHPRLDVPIGDPEAGTTLLDLISETGFNTPTLTGLDGYIEGLQRQKVQRIGLELETYMQQDPDGKLQNCYPVTHPDCNCHKLCLRRYLQEPPDTFDQIAQDFNMKCTQVTNHWYGRCKTLLQTIAVDLGYRPDEDL
ncbi:MAG: hypothetical protein JO235_17325 [Chroococcidiopsidaceae cyanobacterium CP_BM_RX_35]|nr:hypothetical protein [Chroococcidiopsidaceae cyanobacterium CP_BM_RX_35]